MEYDKIVEENQLKRNASGYSDNTAYTAIKKADKDADAERFYKLLMSIFNLCELAGFHIEERLVIKDKKTGKIWR